MLLAQGSKFKKLKLNNQDVFVYSDIIADFNYSFISTIGDIDFNNCVIVPGLVDVHVHLREPGFLMKETIATGTAAAARGGYTDVCSMPNLSPVPDSAEHIQLQLEIIRRDAHINVYPYASITKEQLGNQLSDMAELADKAVAFSDDGRGVQSDEMMYNAMTQAKQFGKIIVAHCEVNSLLQGGYIHDGEYARLNGHKGICSESEWGQIKRDIDLVRQTGCKYHVCHISTKESVDLIRKAKAEGLDITCETAPHYLVLNDMQLRDEGRFKMNPPIRSEEDRRALVQGILDGTIDMIATDHAPHTALEKSKGLKGSLMGVVGLETAFAVMYTSFVKTGILSLERLIELMSINPKKRFGIGSNADFTVFDLENKYIINPDEFVSMGRSTPFESMEVYGKCKLTVCNGKIAYKD